MIGVALGFVGALIFRNVLAGATGAVAAMFSVFGTGSPVVEVAGQADPTGCEPTQTDLPIRSAPPLQPVRGSVVALAARIISGA